MKKHILFILMGVLAHFTQAQLVLESGAQLVAEGNLQIVVQDLDWQHEGSFTPDSSTVHVRGNISTEMGGSNALSLFRLTLNKSSGDVRMSGEWQVFDNLRFNQGNLDLQGNALLLQNTGPIAGPGGRLINEAETRRVFSSVLGGYIRRRAVYSGVVAADSGNLGLFITSSASMGRVTLTRSHDPQVVGGAPSVLRYYDVNPQFNSGLNASLRFTYLNAETNGLPEEDLELFLSNNNGNSYTPEGYSLRDSSANFVELTGIDQMSRWTLSDFSGTSFPVEWLGFDAWLENGQVRCQWLTASEINSDYFEVQRSQDGSVFEPIGTVPAAGNSQSPRGYELWDPQPFIGRSWYRVKQVDLDGAISYSSLAAIEVEGQLQAQLAPNPTQGSTTLFLSTPFETLLSLQLTDMRGRSILTQNTQLDTGSHALPLDLTPFAEGVYTLRVKMGTRIQTFRIMRN